MDTIAADVARSWIERWDRQQERYIPEREERFDVLIDVVETVTAARARPVVVDVGCGPGSLSGRLAGRIAHAEIVGVDADPLLLALGNADPRTGVRLVRADLTDPSWPDDVGIDRPWDAVVSSTALHWLEPPALSRLYGQLAERLRPGGVLVNADHMHVDPALDELAATVGRRHAARAGVSGNEDWASWWAALRADAELAGFVGDRTANTTAVHSAESELSVADHTALLRAAGFTTAGPIWQHGDDHVLVAVR